MKRPKLSSLFRWGYVAPRAAIVAGVWLGVHFGLDPFLKWALVVSSEATLGAKVDVGSVHTALRSGELEVTGMAAANPSKPMRNLLEAERLQLVVDPGQLLRKRVVVHDGLIEGIQFDSERKTSGALPTTPSDPDAGPSMFDPMLAAAGESANQWFGTLQGNVADDLEAKLETPRLLRDLQNRWPKQYEALIARADSLRAQSKQLERDVREAKKNPLRALEQLEQVKPRLAATEAELRATLGEINGLPEQAKADRLALDAARKHDEQFLREQMNVGNIDGAQLTQYLLGETASGYLSQATYWIEQARRWAPQKKMAKPERSRGVNVAFIDRRRPQMLIERVRLAGHARLGGDALTVTGELTDAASEPQWHQKPMRLELKTSGALAATMLVELDRRTEMAHDSLVIDCPRVAAPGRNLGKAGSLAVKVAPGEASFKADIHLDGDTLVGTITFHQSATLEASTPSLRDDRIAAMLNESLAGVDRLEATVKLAGTLKRPDVKIESNVGPQLAAGISGAMRKYLTERRDRVLAKVQGQADEQLAKLDAAKRAAQKELLGALGEDQQLVTQLASIASGKISLNDVVAPKLGKALQGTLKR